MAKFLNVFNLIAAIVLSFIYSALITSILLFFMTMKVFPKTFPPENEWWGLLIGTALFLILILVWYGFNMLLNKFNLDRRNIFRLILIIIIAIPLAILRRESPPIPIENDYSWEDVIAPPKNAKKSYATFIKLVDLDMDYSFTNIPLKEVEINNADMIENSWKNNTEVHNWMKELDSYDGIADLTVELDGNYRKTSKMLIKVAILYCGYAKLKIKQKDFESAADSLLILNSIVQKSYPYTRTLLNQLIFSSIEGRNLKIMDSLIKNKNCPRGIIQEIKNSVQLINTNFKSCLISDYLIGKTFLEKGGFIVYEMPNSMRPIAGFAARFITDKNKVLRIQKQCIDVFISCISKNPPDFTPFNERIKLIKAKRKLENPITTILSVSGESILPAMYKMIMKEKGKRKEFVEELQRM